MEWEDVPRETVFFSRCSYFIHLCDRLEISLLFSPALGTFHLSFFLSVFFLLVQSKVRRLPTQLLCQSPRTRRLFLVLPVGKVGEWDGGPWLYRVQNPMEDSLSEGSWGALSSASPGLCRLSRAGHQTFRPRAPMRGKGHSAGGLRMPVHPGHPGCEAVKPSHTQKSRTRFLGKGRKYHDLQ